MIKLYFHLPPNFVYLSTRIKIWVNIWVRIHHHIFNNQSLELSPLNEIDNIIQDEEEIFKKNPTVSLPEVSKLIDLAISKRQGDRRHSFLERKKILHKRETGFTMSTQNITSLEGSSCEAIHLSVSGNTFSYLKMSSMQFRKNITVEDDTKRMNITNLYTNIYTYTTCDKNDSK